MNNRIKSHFWVKGITYLLLLLPLMSLSAQQKTTKGIVVDEKLLPIEQAEVTVNGSVLSTTQFGVFSFESEEGAIITVAKKSYITEKVKVTGKSVFVILRKNQLEVNQSVAYGSQSRGSVTSSMSVVDGDQLNNSASNLGSALYGRLHGLFLQQGTGEPGEDQPLYAFIRGKATFGAASNQPLVLVDGFERDMNTIQIEDVENVAVLKDAAATALYGARGANGVIQVTTKRGQEGKIRFSANVQTGVQSATLLPDFLSSYDYSNAYRRAYEMDVVPWNLMNGTTADKAPYLTSLPDRYKEGFVDNYLTGDPYYYPNINWLNEMTKASAPHYQADMNVSGGNKVCKYYVSLNYQGTEGLFKNTESDQGWSSNSKVDRFRIRGNVDVNITKNWVLKADVAAQIDTKNKPLAGASDLWNSIYKIPTNQFPVILGPSLYGGSTDYTMNPLAELNYRGYQTFHPRTIMSNLETRYDFGSIVKGFQVGLRFGYDNSYSNREGWSRKYQVAEVLSQDLATGNPVLGKPIGTSTNIAYSGPDSDTQGDRMTFEGFAEYNRTFGNGHNVSAMAMFHQDKYILNGDPKPYKNQSLGGHFGYDFKKKYFGELTLSYSGTENFTNANRFGLFPALSAGWMISEENFMKPVKMIDYLKLRGSAGVVGNSAVGERFTYIQQYNAVSNAWVLGDKNTGVNGLSEGTYPNVNFSFETAYKYEVGFDANILKMMNVWANFYLENRTNILTTQSSLVPAIFGAVVGNINAGTAQRKGIEAGITLKKQYKDWGYSVGFNAAYNVSKIIKINEEPQPESYLYTQGYQIGQPFMLEAVGFFKDPADIAASPIQKFGEVKPGDIKYKDQNNDGIIDDKDRKAFFNPNWPKAEFGLNLSLRFKGFDVAAFFQSQLGRSVSLLDNQTLFYPLQNKSARISTYAANSWTPETSETANYPRLSTVYSANNNRSSTFWFKNGDFIRLRNIEFGYSLPHSLMQQIKVTKARIFVRGLNLFTWDHIQQVDPESLSGYPVMKSYNVGLNLEF